MFHKKLYPIICGMFAITFMACNPQDKKNAGSFHINGTIADASDGDLVMLQVENDQNMETLYETKVTNHTFTFEGSQDSTIECSVVYIVKGSKQGATFFLENGTINMKLSETSSITGTENNNRYQDFLNEINAIYGKMSAVYNNEKGSNEDSVNDQVKQLDSKANSLIIQTINSNINNPVGFYLFRRFHHVMSIQKQNELISKLPVSLRKDPVIEDIKAQIAILPADSIGNDTVLFDMDYHDDLE